MNLSKHFKPMILSVLASMLFSCSTGVKKEPKRFVSSLYGEEKYSYHIDFAPFHKEIDKFQVLLEESLVWRTLATGFLQDVKQSKVLTNKQLVLMHEEGAEKYLELRDRFFSHINEIKWVSDKTSRIILRPGQPTEVIEKKRKRKVGNFEKWITYRKIYINPLDEQGSILVKRIRLGLAATLNLYDNYIVVIGKFDKIKKLRHLLNYDNADLKYPLAKITKSFNSSQNFAMTARSLKFLSELEEYEKENKIEIDDDQEYLNLVIKGTVSYGELNKKFHGKIWRAKIGYLGNFMTDYFREAKNNVTHVISKFFGNTVGMVQSRKGKLYGLTDEQLDEMAKEFRPLDILLEKTPFRLTDRFIPGHWGHVAVWTGTKEELVELGLWEHELIKPHQHAIEFEGARIIEALRPGVQYNTLRHFMDIDDLAIVRPKDLSLEKKREYLENAFRQIGKSYDFNFDVETNERIVCSELAYVTYPDYKWPTDKAVGRYTISPDHVAMKTGVGKPFETVLIYHDGKKINTELEENFERLLNLEYDQITYK